jgi:hypothetical protein
MILPAEYFDAENPNYIDHAQWREMWREAMRLDYDPIVHIEVMNNPMEVAKYVTKPSGYLTKLPDGSWQVDVDVLETLHYALAGRRMVSWSRSLSPFRKALGFLDDDDDEDLVDVGDDDNTDGWVVVEMVVYRWGHQGGRYGYYLVSIHEPRVDEGDGHGEPHYVELIGGT